MINDAPITLDENRPTPHVLIKQLDTRAHCWGCGKALDDNKYRLSAHHHNSCLARKYQQTHALELADTDDQAKEPDFFDYLDSAIAKLVVQ